MMFGAVTLAWLRLWLANALTREVAATRLRWASVMDPEAV